MSEISYITSTKSIGKIRDQVKPYHGINFIRNFFFMEKETYRRMELYVDLFPEINRIPSLREWERKLKSSDFKTVFFYKEYQPVKNSRTSDFLRCIGNMMFTDKEWLNAMEYYSAMLCFAECGTNNVNFFLMPIGRSLSSTWNDMMSVFASKLSEYTEINAAKGKMRTIDTQRSNQRKRM